LDEKGMSKTQEHALEQGTLLHRLAQRLMECAARSVPMTTARPVIPSEPISPTSMLVSLVPLATTEAMPSSRK
jgi:hypothetical protein